MFAAERLIDDSNAKLILNHLIGMVDQTKSLRTADFRHEASGWSAQDGVVDDDRGDDEPRSQAMRTRTRPQRMSSRPCRNQTFNNIAAAARTAEKFELALESVYGG
jgi:hypothetical protein